MNALVLRCTCKHSFQDERYGDSMRLHNEEKKGAKATSTKYRCTVCGHEKEV